MAALTVPQPASSFTDQFGWLFHSNCHLDASIYQDDEEIMEFSDSSVEYPTYQHNSNQQQHQVSKSITLKNPYLYCFADAELKIIKN
jgi:hypothetical protein